MMKNNQLEHIILYLLVACAALVFATLARVFTISMGFDDFTAFIVFIVALAIQVVIYLSIRVVLQDLMLPWIGKGLAKIPYFRNKIEQRQLSIIEERTLAEEVEATEEETVEEKMLDEEINKLLDIPELSSLEDIRQEQLQIRIKEQEDKLNVALNYTRKSFVLYLSDKDLDILCHNAQIYINKLDTAGLHPVKVRELTAVDLRHFGWNIWNFFKPREQVEIAGFLKTVFPDIFRGTEIKSIKRHLKDDELKGIIKIQDKLL
jgi:hypothetical protein